MNIYEIGQKIKLKKMHPCGGYEWEVVRTGADIKIKCLTCGHVLMMPRDKLEKSVKEINKSIEK